MRMSWQRQRHTLQKKQKDSTKKDRTKQGWREFANQLRKLRAPRQSVLEREPLIKTAKRKSQAKTKTQLSVQKTTKSSTYSLDSRLSK